MTTFSTMRRSILLLAAMVTASIGAAGCADTSATPAADPASATPKPTALTLAIVPGLADVQVEAFQDLLAEGADAGITLELSDDFDAQNTVGVEQQIVRAVADGEVDLGWVGARAFSELGVADFDALVAPMVLDSMAGQRAVLDSEVPGRMLQGLEPIGVTGLAVVGGPFRRPITAGPPLRRPADFDGVRFYTFRGAVSAASVEALGATNVDATPEERNRGIEAGSITAYESSLAFLADNPEWRADAMTLNLNLWPGASVLVANPATLARLAEDQRDALLAAADKTAAGALDRLPDEAELATEACRGGARLAVANDADVAAIESVLQPVIAGLRNDRQVAAYLDRIEELADGAAPDPVLAPDCETLLVTAQRDATDDGEAAPVGAAGEMDGTYTVAWTVEDLTEALGGDSNPEAAAVAQGNAGTLRLVLDHGRYELRYENGDSCPGSYAVEGDRLILTATTRPSDWDCGDGLGEVFVDARWRLTDAELTLTDWELTPEPSMIWFAAALLGSKPLERIEP